MKKKLTVGLAASAAIAAAVTVVAPSAHADHADDARLPHLGSTHAATRLGTKHTTAAVDDDTFALGRVFGPDRYLTSAAVAALFGPAPSDPNGPISDMVFVASGANFPDGLAAGAAAGAHGSPLLLVPADGTVPAATIAQIKRIRPKFIVIAGGFAAVSTKIEKQLQPLVPASSVLRAEGGDRYQTASMLADIFNQPVKTVYVASGEGFADALAAGAAAGANESPLLLTNRMGLPASTAAQLQHLAPSTVVVAGGTGAVSDTVVTAINKAVPGAKVQRLSGPTRYETAVELAKSAPANPEVAFLASGETFPDALSASAAAAGFRSPLLLGRRDCTPKVSIDELKRRSPKEVLLVGGASVIAKGDDITPC